MGKKESKKKVLARNSNLQPHTIREEIRGKSESSVKGLHDVNGVLRLKYLQKIALWAGGEASSPSFGAYFGYQLAASREALGIRSNDSSIISCQSCESLLQPGLNCRVRIEKNVFKGRSKMKDALLQNNVVYTCEFCSYRNVKPGTLKGYLKTFTASKVVRKFGSETKIVNKGTAELDTTLLRMSTNKLQNMASVSPEKVLFSAKRGDEYDSSRMNSTIELDVEVCKKDTAGLAAVVQDNPPALFLVEQTRESASASVQSKFDFWRQDAKPVVEADRLKKVVDMQEPTLQGSARASLGRMIGETSVRKRKQRKTSNDSSSVQPESSTRVVCQESINQVSSRHRRKSSWSSLKELTHEEQDKRQHYGDLSIIAIPFSL